VSDPFLSQCRREPTGRGLLDGTTFAIKDIFHVAGELTGFGSPDWRRTHTPSDFTSRVIETLLASGASLRGRTHMEELAFSLTGENAHYGTPRNPSAPDRIPGGSSSGSAVAVAAGLVDFALGTDTGGSVRVPASFCGLYGIRPTHGAVTSEGVIALARSFDTVGWFARDARLLSQVGRVLIEGENARAPTGLLVAEDALALCDPGVGCALEPWLRGISRGLVVESLQMSLEGLPVWAEAFRVLQGREAWVQHGAWIDKVHPQLGPAIQTRFDHARRVSDAEVREATTVRQCVRRRMQVLLGQGAILCLPTAPGPPPLLGQSGPATEAFRWRTVQLTCAAGLAGLPQVSVPVASSGGGPIACSIVANRGSDHTLMNFAVDHPAR
jgi:amidase